MLVELMEAETHKSNNNITALEKSDRQGDQHTKGQKGKSRSIHRITIADIFSLKNKQKGNKNFKAAGKYMMQLLHTSKFLTSNIFPKAL